MSWHSNLPQLIREAPILAAAAVEKTVSDIEAGCKQRSRVDTGEMRNGWHGQMTGAFEGDVSNPVEHTIYNEYGTRHMSAQPMLAPSVEDAREPFVAMVKEAFE